MKTYESAFFRLYMSSENRDSLEEDHSEKTSSLLPKVNNLVKGEKDEYVVGGALSLGKFGGVYEVLRRKDGKKFALKLELLDSKYNCIHVECKILRLSVKNDLKRIPKLIDRGNITGHFKFVVMDLLSQNLSQLRHLFVELRFSPSTSLRLALETLDCIEELHKLHFVHRDIKPSNFVIKKENDKINIYIIDFGLCRSYDREKLIEKSVENPDNVEKKSHHFNGTIRYASITAHNYKEQSPKDDIESWMYMVIEMMNGNLPWGTCAHNEKQQVLESKMKYREQEHIGELLKHCPKTEFFRIFEYLSKLNFLSQIDYTYIKSLIQLAIKNNNIDIQEPYDWEEGSESWKASYQ
uniref:non-specific serine/threonine protein kinase n=1 Tax=Parastrongyloides trichosuri TaxID=131310 RepID=A0A0N5A6J5_PARTI